MKSVASVLLVCGLLVPCAGAQNRAVDPSTAFAQTRTVKLNGGLEAEILSLGRSKEHDRLTVHIRIRNLGKNTAELLLVRNPLVATDNTGGAFDRPETVSGIAVCNNGGWPSAACLGIPRASDYTVPLQGLTQLDPNPDPGAGITVNLLLAGHGDGPLVSFSANVFFRLVADPIKNATLTDAEQYRQFRLMSLSFPSMPVTDGK
jgi:hypothetical protein